MLFFYFLISAMPLLRDPLWEHFMSDLTAVKYLGSACLAYALWHLAITHRWPAFMSTPQARWFLFLVLWAAGSYLIYGPHLPWDQSPILSYISFLLLFIITLSIVDNWRRLEHVLWAIIGADALASLYILREWQKYHAVFVDFRPGWVTGDPNYFTASALIGLPLALVFCGAFATRWKRLLAGGAGILMLVAIALAASRGGMLGLGAAVVFLAWRRRRLRLLIALSLLTLPILIVWPNSPLNRLLHPTFSDRQSTDMRLALWQAGMRMIAEHPVTGIGLGNFKFEVQQYAAGHKNLDHIAHNAYMEIAAEMGLPALAAYLLLLYYSTLPLIRLARMETSVRRESKPSIHERMEQEFQWTNTAECIPYSAAENNWKDALPAENGVTDLAPEPPSALGEDLPAWAPSAALGLQAALLGFSVSAIFLSAQYTKLFWLLLALSAAIPTLVAHTSEVHATREAEEFAVGPEETSIPVMTGIPDHA